MNINKMLWDANFGNNRTAEEWKELFDALRESLAMHLGFPVHVEQIEIDDDIDAKHSSIGGSVRIPVSDKIDLTLLGTLTLSVNHEQCVSVYALLLMFCCGKRMSEHKLSSEVPSETLVLQLRPNGDFNSEWTHRLGLDESGEWEEYMSLEDWKSEC